MQPYATYAHRLSTLSEMDRIIVIEHGVCAEDGTHLALLAQNGIYARLWRRQQQHVDDPFSSPPVHLPQTSCQPKR